MVGEFSLEFYIFISSEKFRDLETSGWWQSIIEYIHNIYICWR